MPLFAPLRRWLVLAILAALVVPSLGMLVVHPRATSMGEKRVLAPRPAAPSSLSAWVAFPRNVDAYLRDHFAFRTALTTADARLRWRLGGQLAGGKVVRGHGNWLVMTDELLHVTGGEVRTDEADDYADFICDMNRRLRARGVVMAASIAPSPGAIYPEALPDWVPKGSPSEYDLSMARERACGVTAGDLRPALIAAKPSGAIYYHHDTHWTPKGALIAYNDLVRAIGRPDWVTPASTLPWRRGREDNSDLVALSGMKDVKRDLIDLPDLSARRTGVRRMVSGIHDYDVQSAFTETEANPGPTVLFIGDSYSREFMAPYFAPHVGRFVWMHQQWCGFDWRIFDIVKPDDVIVMPVDRAARCRRGQRPLHMKG